MKEGRFGAYTCSVCKLNFPFEKIKYKPDGKLICIECKDKLQKQKSAQPAAASKESVSSATERCKNRNMLDYVKVFCRDCNYKFLLKKNPKTKIMCPYCGKGRISKDVLSAETILNRIIEDDWP